MLAEDVLSIGAVAGTRMMCSDSQVMAQESRYLGLLARVASYRISAGVDSRTAELFDGEGTRILEYVDGWRPGNLTSTPHV